MEGRGMGGKSNQKAVRVTPGIKDRIDALSKRYGKPIPVIIEFAIDALESQIKRDGGIFIPDETEKTAPRPLSDRPGRHESVQVKTRK